MVVVIKWNASCTRASVIRSLADSHVASGGVCCWGDYLIAVPISDGD